jgi:NTP pyrophosphatase (non-canonical NTP hydrolase)
MKWNQRKITDWATKNFGHTTPREVAIRGNKEMAELLSEFENRMVDKIPAECADICIFLMQVCEKLGVDLLEEVDKKMDINEERTWRIAPDGSFQHVD